MMPPEHTVSPAAWAARMAATLSSKVWVVQTLGKFRQEVSRLLWARSAPASFSLRYCSSSSSPAETQTEIPTSLRICRMASHSASTSPLDRRLPEVTME